MLDNAETIRILVSTLGHPMFEVITKPKKKDLLICKGEGVYAEGELLDDGFVVFAGSTCKTDETPTIGKWTSELRARLVDEGILVLEEDVHKLSEDYIFSSPSAAAATVLARSANGWMLWKYADGRTLDEVRRQGDTKDTNALVIENDE